MVRKFYYMPDILHGEEEVYVDIYRAEEYIHRNIETSKHHQVVYLTYSCTTTEHGLYNYML